MPKYQTVRRKLTVFLRFLRERKIIANNDELLKIEDKTFSELIDDVSDYTTKKGNNKYIKTVLKPLQEIYEDINDVIKSLKGDTKFDMSHNRYEQLQVVFNKLGRDAIPTVNNTNASLMDKGDIPKQYRLVPYGLKNFSEDTVYFKITNINDIRYCLPVDEKNKPLGIRLVDVLGLFPEYENIMDLEGIRYFVEKVLSEVDIVKNNFVKITPYYGKIDETFGYDIALTSNGVFMRDRILRKENKKDNEDVDNNRFKGKSVRPELFHPLSSLNICGMLPKIKSVSNIPKNTKKINLH